METIDLKIENIKFGSSDYQLRVRAMNRDIFINPNGDRFNKKVSVEDRELLDLSLAVIDENDVLKQGNSNSIIFVTDKVEDLLILNDIENSIKEFVDKYNTTVTNILDIESKYKEK